VAECAGQQFQIWQRCSNGCFREFRSRIHAEQPILGNYILDSPLDAKRGGGA
jgi:hypothetical protein